MFKDYKSKLRDQIKTVSGGTIEECIKTQFEYACKESTNVPAERKRILFPEKHVRGLVQLFRQSIDSTTFEHMVAIGEEVGLGLFSFADLKKDPKLGLYLVYRESMMPFTDIVPEFYLGAFENPCDYDQVFREGVRDTIAVIKNGFSLRKSSNLSAKTIEGLFDKELLNIVRQGETK